MKISDKPFSVLYYYFTQIKREKITEIIHLLFLPVDGNKDHGLDMLRRLNKHDRIII